MSGPHGDAYCVARESEDIRALVEKTGARYVFGLSSGAIVAISAALAIPDIEKVAAYEPPYAITPFDPVGWVPRFDREIGEGKLGHALLTVMKGTGDSELLRRAPRFLLAPLLELAVRQSARTVAGGDVPLAELIPTMHYDARIVAEASRTVSELTGLGAEVLLIGGSNSADFLRGVLDALPRFLPHAARIELSSANHTSADNEGDPMAVAAALRRFFEAPRARAIAS
jgi:pimeloyl-ACP methyl ester carboxylesterase